MLHSIIFTVKGNFCSVYAAWNCAHAVTFVSTLEEVTLTAVPLQLSNAREPFTDTCICLGRVDD